jgi:hypothetical protein
MKKEKAQVMLLDVVFSVVIIILLFFLLFRFTEIQIYNSSLDKANYELEKIGTISFNRIVNNPKINCVISDTNNQIPIPNCLAPSSEITLKTLGIPENYDCNFTVSGTSFAINECNSNLPSDTQYYAVSFDVLIGSDKNIPKSEYMNSILGNSSTITSKSAKLVIWDE